MLVFVTGGTGLVGSHVIERLHAAGHSVVALTRDDRGAVLVESLGAKAVRGVVEAAASWSAARDADAIVHAAALITQREPWERFESVNIRATRLAAETAAQSEARLVHISSIAVYGRRLGAPPNSLDENAPWTALAQTDFYARSKRLAEEAVWSVARKTALSAVALRPCVIYGERDRVFLPRVIAALRFGIAPVVGHGNNTLTTVYAGNVADAVVCALAHPEVNGCFNVTNDGTLTQREFFTAVGDSMGRNARLVSVPLPAATAVAATFQTVRRLFRPKSYSGMAAGAARFLAADNPYRSDRARQQLNWTPGVSALDAVRRSVKWFMEQE